MLSTVRILPQKGANQLKPAQKFFQLAGVCRHLRRNSILPSGLDRDGFLGSVYHTEPPNRKSELHKIHKKMT